MSAAQTLSARVHDAILEMVIDSGASSEDLLLTEGELVERFGVSKAPVREALLRLCAEEVLKSIPRYGYVVVQLGAKSGRDNLAVRKVLELTFLEKNFDLFTPEKLDEMEKHLSANRKKCEEDPTIWTIWQANQEFHCELISVADNRYLAKHLKNCIDVEQRYYAQNHYKENRRFVLDFTPESHENILRAIREGNREKALELLDQDITDGKTV